MLHLSYTLHDHGWATASITNAQTSLEIQVSYLSDALGDLARAVRAILRGHPEATFSFQQEPGEHRVIIKRHNHDVHLEIYTFPDTFSKQKQGHLAFSANCTLRELATQCINALRHIRDQHGEAGYQEKWKNHNFPTQEYHDLLTLRRELPAVHPAQ